MRYDWSKIRSLVRITLRLSGSLLLLFFWYRSLQPPADFEASKRHLWTIFESHPITFYCGCRYSTASRTIQPPGCPYRPDVQENWDKRAFRVEAEHLVPAARFGRELPCWRRIPCYGPRKQLLRGRACCRATDGRFRRMEADLYNLVPAIGGVNATRSHFDFVERFLPQGSVKAIKGCDMLIDPKRKKAMPPATRRGWIARAYLYMHERYGLFLSDEERIQYRAWDADHPPTAWEWTWSEQVAFIEQHRNPWIERHRNTNR